MTSDEDPCKRISSSDIIRRRSSAFSAFSCATSTCDFPEPSQTLIFLDWDDTLFPTSDMLDRWEIPEWLLYAQLSQPLPENPELKKALRSWSRAVEEFLRMASSLSERVVVVTNAKRPWVERCIDRFAPNLRPLFCEDSGHCSVVYAGEALQAALEEQQAARVDPRARGPGGCLREWAAGVQKWWRSEEEEEVDRKIRVLTDAKHAAMKRQASQFYSQYCQQTWKNIFSMGDMRYEYQALKDLHNFRAGACERERLRLKAVVVPPKAEITELTLNLRILAILFPAMVHYDGGMDLDLRSDDPIAATAEALDMPELEAVPLPRHAWGQGPAPKVAEVELALDELAMTLQGHVAASKEAVQSQRIMSARKNKGKTQHCSPKKSGMSFVDTPGKYYLEPRSVGSRRGGS